MPVTIEKHNTDNNLKIPLIIIKLSDLLFIIVRNCEVKFINDVATFRQSNTSTIFNKHIILSFAIILSSSIPANIEKYLT